MNYQFGDGWIFRSIHLTKGDEGVSLEDMIGTADFINKAIPTTDEINHACTKLIKLGFLIIKNKNIFITKQGSTFIENIQWDFDRPQHPCEFASEIATKLKEVKLTEDGIEVYFTKADVKTAQEKYNAYISKSISEVISNDDSNH